MHVEYDRVERSRAVERVRSMLPDGECLVCAMLAGRGGPLHLLQRGQHASAVLAGFALRPGHILVLLHDHETDVGAASPEAWLEAASLAQRSARAQKRVLAPARSYVASLGTDAEVPMSSPHVHLHVIPVGEGEKPKDVLTWSNGVYVGPEAAFAALATRLRDELWADSDAAALQASG